MNGSNENPRHYKWPWVAAAAVILAIILAVVWMRSEVKKIEFERDLNGRLPSSGPAR